MTRTELLTEIEHALKYRQCRSEEAEEINQAFKDLKQDLERLEQIDNLKTTPSVNDYCIGKCIKLEKENEKLKQVLDILEVFLKLEVKECHNLDKSITYVLIYKSLNNKYSICIDKEKYELLKKVLGNENSNL